MLRMLAWFDGVEGAACLRINRLSHRHWIRALFTAVSKLGDGGYWVAMAALLVVLQGAAAWASVSQLALTAMVGVLLYRTLKLRLVRERPYISHAGILLGTAPLDRYSFPSGHTLHAVCFTVLLVHAEPLLLALTAPFALLVAASRVVLGLHYPSDVAVGAALGALLAALSIAAFGHFGLG